MTDDPRGRLERALDRAPFTAARVNALSLEDREWLAQRAMARGEMPEHLAAALATLPDDEVEQLGDLRLVVAATDQLVELRLALADELRAEGVEDVGAGIGAVYLDQLDGGLVDAAAAGILRATAQRFAELVAGEMWPATAVMLLQPWIDEQMGPPPS
jgi:hypothetical protein